MKTQLEKIEKCMEAIDEIRDFFDDPNIDSYLIGAEEGLHLAKVEIEKKARESKIAIDLERKGESNLAFEPVDNIKVIGNIFENPEILEKKEWKVIKEDVMQKLYRENRPETYKYDVSDTAERKVEK